MWAEFLQRPLQSYGLFMAATEKDFIWRDLKKKR